MFLLQKNGYYFKKTSDSTGQNFYKFVKKKKYLFSTKTVTIQRISCTKISTTFIKTKGYGVRMLYIFMGCVVKTFNKIRGMYKFYTTELTLRRLMSYIYMEHPFLMFLDHTQRRSTVGRTPLDE